MSRIAIVDLRNAKASQFETDFSKFGLGGA